MATVQETIGCPHWVIANYAKLRQLFPEHRTLVGDSLMARLGCGLRVLGVDWRNQTEVGQALVLCHHMGLFHQEIRRNCLWIQRCEQEMPCAAFFEMSPAQIRVNRILRETPSADVQDLAAKLIQGIMYKTQR